MSAESQKWLNRAAAAASEPEPESQLADDSELGLMLRRPRELGHACWDNDAAAARRLIREGADANDPEQFWSRSAPLSDAAYRGHAAIVQLLLDAGADTRWADEFGETALHRAAANGHEEVARVLVEHSKASIFSYGMDARDHAAETPLIFAVRSGAAGIVKLLLGATADPTIRSPQQGNQTVLELADAAMAAAAAAAAAAADDAGATAAEVAAVLRGDVRVQRLEEAAAAAARKRELEQLEQQRLLQPQKGSSKKGKKSSKRDAAAAAAAADDPMAAHIQSMAAAALPETVYSITTLGEAAVLNDLAAVKRLLASKADPNNAGHREARRRFVKAQKKTFETREEEAEAMATAEERLWKDLEECKDPGQFYDQQGVSGDDLGLCAPLWLAAHHGNREIVELLLGAKANVAWADDDGATALHESAKWWGHDDIVQLLLGGGAPIDAIDEQNNTALICAAAAGYTAAVAVLLGAGADTALRSGVAHWNYGDALEVAEQERKWSVVAMLGNPSFSVAEAEARADATETARLSGLADGPMLSGTRLRILPPQEPPEPPLTSTLKKSASKEEREAAKKEQKKIATAAKRQRQKERLKNGGRVCVYKNWQKRSIGSNVHAVRFEDGGRGDAATPWSAAAAAAAQGGSTKGKGKDKSKGKGKGKGTGKEESVGGTDSDELISIKLKKLEPRQWLIVEALEPEPEPAPQPQAEAAPEPEPEPQVEAEAEPEPEPEQAAE